MVMDVYFVQFQLHDGGREVSAIAAEMALSGLVARIGKTGGPKWWIDTLRISEGMLRDLAAAGCFRLQTNVKHERYAPNGPRCRYLLGVVRLALTA